MTPLPFAPFFFSCVCRDMIAICLCIVMPQIMPVVTCGCEVSGTVGQSLWPSIETFNLVSIQIVANFRFYLSYAHTLVFIHL